MTHQELISEVLMTLRFPAEAADIKRRIESLIERESLGELILSLCLFPTLLQIDPSKLSLSESQVSRAASSQRTGSDLLHISGMRPSSGLEQANFWKYQKNVCSKKGLRFLTYVSIVLWHS